MHPGFLATGRDTERHVAAILNAGRLVREYRLQRTPFARVRRAQAIQRLGLAVRAAFNASDDFEPLLVAVVDSLRPRDDPPF